MPGSAVQRARLIARLRARGTVRTPAVIDAFRAVPREHFTPDGTSLETSYEDRALVLTEGADGRATSTISQPSMVALMLEQLGVRRGDRVLEIGTASGYNAALLAELTGEDGRVYSVELDPDLADRARERLADPAPNVTVITGDGWLGVPEAAPFDRIVVTVGVEDLAPSWTAQLADGGTLVAPLSLVPGLELSLELQSCGGSLRSASVQPCGFVRLRGPHAGPSTRLATPAGLMVTRDPLDEDTARHVLDVLEGPPRDGGAAPEPPPGWGTWLGLERPETVLLAGAAPEPGTRIGILDPGSGGVAVLGAARVWCFGDLRAADLLRATLARAEPVDARQLCVLVRDAEHRGPGGRWVIRRPHHQYVLWLGPE